LVNPASGNSGYPVVCRIGSRRRRRRRKKNSTSFSDIKLFLALSLSAFVGNPLSGCCLCSLADSWSKKQAAVFAAGQIRGLKIRPKCSFWKWNFLSKFLFVHAARRTFQENVFHLYGFVEVTNSNVPPWFHFNTIDLIINGI
jgi:hypothetical protein